MSKTVVSPLAQLAIEFAERERARANELGDQLRLVNGALRRADKERAELRHLLAAAQSQLFASVGVMLARDTALAGPAPEGDPAEPQARRLGFQPSVDPGLVDHVIERCGLKEAE